MSANTETVIKKHAADDSSQQANSPAGSFPPATNAVATTAVTPGFATYREAQVSATKTSLTPKISTQELFCKVFGIKSNEIVTIDLNHIRFENVSEDKMTKINEALESTGIPLITKLDLKESCIELVAFPIGLQFVLEELSGQRNDNKSRGTIG